MQPYDKRSSYLCLSGVLFFSAVALSAAVDVAGTASPFPALRGLEDQVQHGAKDETRFDSNRSASRTVIGQPERLSKTDLVQAIQFMPHLGVPGPAQGMMGPPPFPVVGPGFPDGMPPKFPPGKICLEDISRHMAIYAYIKSQLQLADNQKAAAKAVDDAIESSAGKLRALCQTLPTEVTALPGIMETADFMEKELAARLDLLRALKGPMQDLFGQLSPDQRAVLDSQPPLSLFPPL
jgi:LTXXQ motif family protein